MSNSYLDLIFVIGFSWCGREVFFFLVWKVWKENSLLNKDWSFRNRCCCKGLEIGIVAKDWWFWSKGTPI